MARTLSARADQVRLAVRDGDQITHQFRSARWPTTEPDLPLAVYLARGGRFHTLALDVDRGGQRGVHQAVALGSILKTAGVAFVEAISGPQGHRHLLATWPAGLDAGQVAALAKALRDTLAPDLDITPMTNPKTGCIRPPGALHRHGGRSKLVGSQAAALAVLRAGNPPEAFTALQQLVGTQPRAGAPNATLSAALMALPLSGSQPHLVGARRDLSPSVERHCRSGGVDGWQENRSATAAAVTLGMVNASWTFPDFLAAVLDQQNVGLDHLRTQRTANGRLVPRTDVKATARRMWAGRIRFALAHPPQHPPTATPPGLDQVAAAAAAADPRRWAGQGGPSERAVLEVLLGSARRTGRPVVGGAVRTLALKTGLTPSTTARALTRLRQGGWLDVVAVGQGREATTYRLRVPDAGVRAAGTGTDPGGTLARRPCPTEESAAPAVFELGVQARAHDAMTWRGLGRYGGLLLDVLRAGPHSPAQMAARTGLNARTVRLHLRRLAAASLASPDADGLWRAHLLLLDEAALALGAAGVVSARREQAMLERATWAWWLADFVAERGYATARGVRRPGMAVMSSGAPCPAQPFPADATGCRSWSAGLAFVQDGLGLLPHELASVDSRCALPVPRAGRATPLRWPRLAASARSPRAGRGGAVRPTVLPFAA